MERTGHRSIEGVRSYKRTSVEQQEVLSDILNNKDKMPKLCNFEVIANPENNSVAAYFPHQQEHLSSQLATQSNRQRTILFVLHDDVIIFEKMAAQGLSFLEFYRR